MKKALIFGLLIASSTLFSDPFDRYAYTKGQEENVEFLCTNIVEMKLSMLSLHEKINRLQKELDIIVDMVLPTEVEVYDNHSMKPSD